jgi:hypothetical protein
MPDHAISLRASPRKITLPPPRDIRVQFRPFAAPVADTDVPSTAQDAAAPQAASQPDARVLRIEVR